ncbi:multidrug efflux system CmeABC, outer membrane lipoprotein CmeC [Campylobacter pinnipediorum subsp. caledonicus]|uniref:TolC family protein n=1 Tax=Campylobacter pinnipediorum TaxID=1965231 RepID=UPI00099553B6|nr:TolC family protein [Campylobacter pinnipediorum]AQW86858.1 multidrug efflux system CmeABC, outer membrane lipoprotein CmeC [Campylobacter pinnipediorum subsp. caledonicus]
MRNIIFFAIVLLFVGCSFKPEMIDVNSSFEYKSQTTNISDKWWEEFNDDKLNSLVNDALKHNIDLKIAYLNLQKADINLNNAKSLFLPTASVTGSATRRGTEHLKTDSFSLNAVLNYEVDLWGRVKNSVESNKALLNASIYDYNASRLSIVSNVVDNYFSLVALKMQENIYKNTLKSYIDTMNYRKKQLEAGAITKSVYIQSVTSVQNASINLNNIKNQIITLSNTLSILAGRDNNEILYSLVNTNKTLPKIPEINADISADILLKRSDVASAYEALRSSNALVGVAKAAYFPSISLSGIFGFSSAKIDNLFDKDARFWSLGTSLTQNIFNLPQTKNRVKLSKIIESENALRYEKIIKIALGEVKTALINRRNLIEIFNQTKELLDSQEKIYELVNSQYDEGYVDHLSLLDAQRNLLSTKLSLVNANLNLNKAVVQVFKAFGGGFKK